VDTASSAPGPWPAPVGYDRLLPGDVRGTIEVLYSKTIEDVYYQNVNFVESGAVSPIDGRPIYKKASTALSNAYLLTNTDKGDQLMESIQLSKTWSNFSMGATHTPQGADSPDPWTCRTCPARGVDPGGEHGG